MRADMLLEYDKKSHEIWCRVPPTEARYVRLENVCRRASEKLGAPGLFSPLHHYDVLGDPDAVFAGGALAPGLGPSHSVCTVTMLFRAMQRRPKGSERLKCIASLAEEMESEYGSAWTLDFRRRSDAVYVDMGFDDAGLSDPRVLDAGATLPGNDAKFLCDCGQFKCMRRFTSECAFAVGPDGKVGRGFYYNDSGRGCHDYVSLGNGRFFRNMGYVDRGYVSNMHSGYSYYARARNIDEKKITVIPRIGHPRESLYEPALAFRSLEEFEIERAAVGGLKTGDACYMYDVVVDSSGEKRSVSCTACWDGSKWVDYYRETEVKDWPASELDPGWSLIK